MSFCPYFPLVRLISLPPDIGLDQNVSCLSLAIDSSVFFAKTFIPFQSQIPKLRLSPRGIILRLLGWKRLCQHSNGSSWRRELKGQLICKGGNSSEREIGGGGGVKQCAPGRERASEVGVLVMMVKQRQLY